MVKWKRREWGGMEIFTRNEDGNLSSFLVG